MSGLSRREALRLGALGMSALALPGLLSACTSDGNPTTPLTTAAAVPSLAPFVASAAAPVTTGLPRRVAWLSTSDAEFFLALSKGMQTAAANRGVQFLTATSGNDAKKNLDQLTSLLARGLGMLAFQPVSGDVQKPALARALSQGVCVQGIISAPCTLQIAANQYAIGYGQGKAAADYARAQLGGKAEVFYFNLDSTSPQLQVRHRGVLDGLKTGGDGVRVVADITVNKISIDAGFATMNTVIQAHPNVSMVLGGDTLVVGAYRALQQSGKLRPEMYLSGVDGDSEALNLIRQGGPYRASTAFAWQLMGYGMGQFGADWIEGKAIPRVIVAKGLLLDSAASVTDYLDVNANPSAVFADAARYQKYLPLLGTTSYADRSTIWQQEVTPP